MTVQELIEALKEFSPDLEVIVEGSKVEYVTLESDDAGKQFVELL